MSIPLLVREQFNIETKHQNFLLEFSSVINIKIDKIITFSDKKYILQKYIFQKNGMVKIYYLAHLFFKYILKKTLCIYGYSTSNNNKKHIKSNACIVGMVLVNRHVK